MVSTIVTRGRSPPAFPIAFCFLLLNAMISTMRIVRGQLLATFVLCVTGFVSVFLQFSIIPSTSKYNRSRSIDYDTIQPDLSAQHHILDGKLPRKYTTTHHNPRRNFSLFLNEETGMYGDNDVQHKGILRIGSEKLGKWPKIRFHAENATFLVGEANAHIRGKVYAKFVDDKRVLVQINESMIPSFTSALSTAPNGLENRNSYQHQIDSMCSLLLNMTRRRNLNEFPERGIPPVVLTVDGDWFNMNDKHSQGSLALSLYGLRVAAATANVDLQIHGNATNDRLSAVPNNRINAEKTFKLRWIAPWFAGYQSAPSMNQSWPYSGTMPTHTDICLLDDDARSYLPVDKMAIQIRHDVRKMAVTLMGSNPAIQRKHHLVPLDNKPWFPDATLDDVIIYLPCHDDASDGSMPTSIVKQRSGLIHFSEYIPLIRQDVRSIGIISQVSHENDVYWCRKASLHLVTYLREAYSGGSVNVSLYDNDPLPVQYARIAMAKQSIGSYSIFPLLAIIGTFGEGHYLHHHEINSRVGMASIIFEKAASYKGFGNLHPWKANKVLSLTRVSSMTWNDVTSWLANDTYQRN
jgi:hypothetical protein